MTSPKVKSRKVIEAMLWIAALTVLAMNIALFRENRRLREAAAPQIARGMQLQMLSGLPLNGWVERVSLPSANSKLLIITFSPGCPACQANQEGWMKLGNSLKQNGLRVWWVSRDPVEITREYCLKHGIPLDDVVADPPYRTYTQLSLARVPNTVLVGPDGTVEKVWAGRLDVAGWNAMFAYFRDRRYAASSAGNPVGAVEIGCGVGSPGAPVRNCN